MSNHITIVVEVSDEDYDADHPTGLTVEAYERITDALIHTTDGIVDISG